MVLLLMIFGQIWGKPWSGENARLVPDFATGPGPVELAGGACLPVPGSITPAIHPVTLVSLFATPERPRGGHPEAKRVGPDPALDLPALVLAQAVAGLAVANGDVDGPAVARRLVGLMGWRCCEGAFQAQGRVTRCPGHRRSGTRLTPSTTFKPRRGRSAWRAAPAPWRSPATPSRCRPACCLVGSSHSMTMGAAAGTSGAA
jgi:hypothetical protein